MPDPLQFSLGLATGGFLGPIGKATAGLAGFLGTTLTVGAAVRQVFDAFERGSALSDLAAQTNESASNLFLLQRGFEVVGIRAERTAETVNNLQQALSPLTTRGKSAATAFRAIGLEAESLARLNTPQQVERIAKALQGLPSGEAAGFAGQIFGEEGGRDILKLARDTESFGKAIRDAVDEAALAGRTAQAFDAISDRMLVIRRRGRSLFAGIAEGALPAIDAVLSKLEGFDPVGFGQKIGSAFSTTFQIFKEGKFSDLIFLSIGEGAEKGFNFLKSLANDSNFWSGLVSGALAAFGTIGHALLLAIELPLSRLQAGFEKITQDILEKPGRLANLIPGPAGLVLGRYAEKGDNAEIKKLLGIPENFKAQSFGEIVEERIKEGVELFGLKLEDISKASGQFADDANSELKQAFNNAQNAATSRYTELRQGLIDSLTPPKTLTEKLPGRDFSESSGLTSFGFKPPSANALEKIGAIFTSSGFLGTDYARQTSQNTQRLIDGQRETNALLRQNTQQGFVHS